MEDNNKERDIRIHTFTTWFFDLIENIPTKRKRGIRALVSLSKKTYMDTLECSYYFRQFIAVQKYYLKYYNVPCMKQECIENVFLGAYILMERITQKYTPSKNEIRYIFIGCLIYSTYWLDDEWFYLDVFVKITNVGKYKLNKIQVALIELLEWNIYICPNKVSALKESMVENN